MTGVFIQKTAGLPSVFTGNGVAPDELTLAGSYASVEQFWAQSIDGAAGVNNIVTLQTSSPAMARLGYQNLAVGDTAGQLALLQSVFGAGRALRIVDTEGHEQYGTITAVQPGAAPVVDLAIASPPILFRGASSQLNCGVMGNGKDHLVNVVNLVKYSLKNLSGVAAYAPLYDTAGDRRDRNGDDGHRPDGARTRRTRHGRHADSWHPRGGVGVRRRSRVRDHRDERHPRERHGPARRTASGDRAG